jgi:hypothetical protein
MPFNPSSKEWWQFKEHTNDMGWTQSLTQQFGIKEPISCMQWRGMIGDHIQLQSF